MTEDASRDSSVLDGKGKIRREGVLGVCILMLLSGLTIVQFTAPPVDAAILYVDGAGSGDYTTIQDAIDNATAGDTVYVYAGYYPENVSFAKTLSLIGMPGARLDSIRIEGSDYVNVTGFEMGSMFMGTGISRNARITNNTIKGSGLSMVMSQYVTIQGNEIYGGGIMLDGGNDNVISDNYLHDNNKGVFAVGSDNNMILNNTIFNNSYGIHFYGRSDYNIISGNNITNNTNIGIYLEPSGAAGAYTRNNYNTISENNISDNSVGIGLGYSTGTEIFHNTLYMNARGIGSAHLCMSPFTFYPDPNTIYHNDFLDNTVQAGDSYDPDEYHGCERMTMWDLGYPLGGNYWSDLSPVVDENRGEAQHIPGPDGLNDFPYNITSYVRDQYPLAEPFNTFTPIQWVPTPTKELWLQVEPSGIPLNPALPPPFGPEYQNLSTEAFEDTTQESQVGEFFWITGPFEKDVNTAGVWNFTTRAWTEGEVQGKLYAKVYRYSENATKELLFTTEAADADVQTFTRRFFWRHNAPEIIIRKGERVIVEILIHVRDAQAGSMVFMAYDHATDYPSSIHMPQEEGIFMGKGKRFMSISKVQGNKSIASVLSSISGKYGKVMAYDPTDAGNHWKEWTSYKPGWMSELTDIDHTMGLMINITDPDGAFVVPPGMEPTGSNNNIQLYTGWNLVGFPSTSNKDRNTGLNNLTVGVEIAGAYWYDSATDEWIEMTDSDSFIVGSAYWLYTNQDCLWDVPL